MSSNIYYYGIAFCLGVIIFGITWATRPTAPKEDWSNFQKYAQNVNIEEEYLDLNDSSTLQTGRYMFEVNSSMIQLPDLINPIKISRQDSANSQKNYCIYISSESQVYTITIEEKHKKNILYSQGECVDRADGTYWLVSKSMGAEEAYYRSQQASFKGSFFYDIYSFSFDDWEYAPKYKRFYECWTLEKEGVNWIDQTTGHVYVNTITQNSYE